MRWDASGTAATELGTLGTSTNGSAGAYAHAINDLGTAVGVSSKYNTSGTWVGHPAVRWDASGTAATELGALGAGPGYVRARAYAVNGSGTAVGESNKYDGSGTDLGTRAVRWDASGTAATELDTLGTDADGVTYARAYAVNGSGTAVGGSPKYNTSGTLLGGRAVRWDGSGTAATELGTLGTSTSGTADADAYAVNDSGTAVGYSSKHASGTYVAASRAVVWGPDALAIDLNDLGVVAKEGGGTWLLTEARTIGADGWVAGTGTFTPTGGTAYTRHWVGQVGLGGSWLTTNATGTWGSGVNWSTGTPATQLDASFDQHATYTVAFDRNEQARKVDVTAGDVTLALGSRSLTVAQGLNVDSGASLSSNGTVIGNVSNAGTLSPGVDPTPAIEPARTAPAICARTSPHRSSGWSRANRRG
ncbi:MAG TPA: hypothetical protein VGR35_17250 [Tepidisphaeraceae bacterium]|nr:hypothetical protein [Tepidisphaeraceae bacterium]